ncbi:helix-turn-helix domain-containing protein [Botrimarina sp.]|uniref:helix-turn-helix domain-containing protein n=1 Tax=Botrimarina sp. TaxID=2795802 RepID=UPI0032EB32E4
MQPLAAAVSHGPEETITVPATLSRPTADDLTAVPRRYLSYREASLYTGYSVRTLTRAIGDGELDCVEHGARRTIDRFDIDAWLAGKKSRRQAASA